MCGISGFFLSNNHQELRYLINELKTDESLSIS